MKRMVVRRHAWQWTVGAVAAWFGLAGMVGAHLDPLAVQADHAFVGYPPWAMDSAKGTVFSVEPDERTAMASTTKSWTLHLAIRAIYDGYVGQFETVTVSANAAACGVGSCQGHSVMRDVNSVLLQAGEQVAFWDLLHGMMYPSGNNAAFAVAEHVALKKYGSSSVALFIADMNAHAQALGLVDTRFHNPSGIDNYQGDSDHRTTAREIAIWWEHALQDPLFRQVVGCECFYSFTTQGPSYPKTYAYCWFIASVNPCNNNNPLYPGGQGLKGGGTSECNGDSDGCMIASARRIGRQLVVGQMQGKLSPAAQSDWVRMLDHGYAGLFQPFANAFSGPWQTVSDQALDCGAGGRVVTAHLTPSENLKVASWHADVDGQLLDLLGSSASELLIAPDGFADLGVGDRLPPQAAPPYRGVEGALAPFVDAALAAARGVRPPGGVDPAAQANDGYGDASGAVDAGYGEAASRGGGLGEEADDARAQATGPLEAHFTDVDVALMPGTVGSREGVPTFVTGVVKGIDVTLATWGLDDDGVPFLRQGGVLAGTGSQVRLEPLYADVLVSAVRSMAGTLVLRSWALGADGSLSPLGTNDVETPARELALVGGFAGGLQPGAIGDHVVTVARDSADDLRVTVWDYVSGGALVWMDESILGGSFAKVSLTGFQYGADPDDLFPRSLYATGAAAAGALQLHFWEVHASGQIVWLETTLSALGEPVSETSLQRLGDGGVVAAVRAADNRVKLVVFEYREDTGQGATSYRLAAHGMHGTPPEARLIDLCRLGGPNADTQDEYVTSFRRSNDQKLELVGWEA